VLITRPLVGWLATARTDMSTGERLFTGWMAPRGIVAAATASTFSAGLVARHIGGAAKILPVTFLVIVVTIAVYGLTAVPVARRLGVTRPARTRPLLVGGDDWVVDLGRALRSLGLDGSAQAGPALGCLFNPPGRMLPLIPRSRGSSRRAGIARRL
jgi:hypothetical protein